MLSMIFWLIVGHMMADMALQSDTMSKGKNRHRKSDYIPEGQKYVACWPYFLCSHAMIHGGAVALVTGSVLLGTLEAMTHWVIDFFKCDNVYNPHVDQALHGLCKIVWIVLWSCGIK